MSLGLYFKPANFDAATYDAAVAELQAAGAGAPAGRSYHIAMKDAGQITVFDVWDSMESFDTFGQTLLPILSALGVDPGEPRVLRVHNVVVG